MQRKFECSTLRNIAKSLSLEDSVLLADVIDATPCDGCEDKQRAIDAYEAFVTRLTCRGGTARIETDRKILEHRTEELCQDDFAGVYFEACDIAISLADELDQMRVANDNLKEMLDRILGLAVNRENDDYSIKARHIRSIIVEGVSPEVSAS